MVRLTQTTRARAALILLLLFAVFSGIRTLQQTLARAGAPLTPVAADDAALAAWRPLLPARGEIGFASDAPSAEFYQRYFAAQYALAPLVVRVVGAEPGSILGAVGVAAPAKDVRYVVGLFRDAAAEEAFAHNGGYHELARNGRGFVLLER